MIEKCENYRFAGRVAFDEGDTLIDDFDKLNRLSDVEHYSMSWEEMGQRLLRNMAKEERDVGCGAVYIELADETGTQIYHKLALKDMFNSYTRDWLSRTRGALSPLGIQMRVMLPWSEWPRGPWQVKVVDTIDEMEDLLFKEIQDRYADLGFSTDRNEYIKWENMVKRRRRREDPELTHMWSLVTQLQEACHEKQEKCGCEECSLYDFHQASNESGCLLGERWRALGEKWTPFNYLSRLFQRFG